VVAEATIGHYLGFMGKAGFYRVDDFRGPDCVGYLVSQAQSAMRPQVEALFEREEINFSHWRVLMCLRDDLARTCADLSRELSHDKGSMTRLIDQLEARHYLRRKRDINDRRIVFLELTAAGRAAAERMVVKVVAYFNDLLDGFSSEEVVALIVLLQKLRHALKGRDTPVSLEAAS
jgi:DNA-binding MarR family transcriptional regulator